MIAPSRRSRLLPTKDGWSMFPGTANTSRPCSAAKRAVISAPLFSGASTTSTPQLRPLILRFRLGNVHFAGGVPGANSLRMQPYSSVSRNSARLETG